MKADVLLGLQWGDEGKGKVVDVLTPDYDLIARFQGGPNAGHTLEFNGGKHVLHTIPSGIFRSDRLNVIGNGLVIDPVVFRKEARRLSDLNLPIRDNLVISRKAHLILPTHRLLDAASELSKGELKIGSTLKGIGPAYASKTAREGIRTGDLFRPDFEEIYRERRDDHLARLPRNPDPEELKTLEEEWMDAVEFLKGFRFEDTDYLINEWIDSGKSVLAEGAQGSMLDIDFGSYPYVTSSSTICAGACTGLGIAPTRIGKVIGISKAYCTRVGSGPFPTELHNTTGDLLRKQGNEFGSTTGRPRRCGWLDLVALRYAIMLNGVTELIITKADVLMGFDKILVATAYRIDGNESNRFPFETRSLIEPVYTELPGWKTDISQLRRASDFPDELRSYLRFIEEHTGVRVSWVSVGADRDAIIRL